MAASDHLGPQWFHGTNAEFKPGDVLSREGAWRANHPDAAAKLHASEETDDFTGKPYTSYSFQGKDWNMNHLWPTNKDGHPVEDHLYVGDHSFMESGENGGYGKNVYQVEPVRKSTKFQPDPNYTREDMTGAYRTKGQLRVVRKVNE